MPNLNTIGILGVDGIAPNYDPNGLWHIWGKHEIWNGSIGKDRYIPKLKDWVIDADDYVVWKVVGHNPMNLVPILQEIRPSSSSYNDITIDRLLGGDFRDGDVYRAYLNTSITPYVIDLDRHCHLYGSEVLTYKLFRGTDISDVGEVISQQYDSLGNFVGNNIGMEIVAFNSHDNHAVKSPKTANCSVSMPDGEIVTAVFYKANGHIASKRQLIVVNTNIVRQAYAEEKYVTQISLASNFLTSSTDDVLKFPMNVPLVSLNLYGRVHYSDGSTLELPIDGDKFSVYGLDQYVSTIIGQRIDLVLSYRLSEGEGAYNVTNNGEFVTAPYTLLTIEANYSYTVKLFGYPEWFGEFQGYRMRWWLLNLDRNLLIDVTDHVVWSVQTGGLNSLGYGIIQNKVVTLNLKDVSPVYNEFIHTQVIDIILHEAITNHNLLWEINNEGIEGRPLYGLGLKCTRLNANHSRFTIHNNIDDIEEWLNELYYRTYPLVDGLKSTLPPEPTHFEVKYENIHVRYSIDMWDQELNMGSNINLYKNVYIVFLRETVSGDQLLSIAGLGVLPE